MRFVVYCALFMLTGCSGHEPEVPKTETAKRPSKLALEKVDKSLPAEVGTIDRLGLLEMQRDIVQRTYDQEVKWIDDAPARAARSAELDERLFSSAEEVAEKTAVLARAERLRAGESVESAEEFKRRLEIVRRDARKECEQKLMFGQEVERKALETFRRVTKQTKESLDALERQISQEKERVRKAQSLKNDLSR